SSETLERIEQGRPDLILLPALGTRTVELTRAITRRFNGIRVVVFGIKELPEAVTEMIEAGAAGYVREDASVDEFREVVRLAARGEARVAPQIASSLFSRLAALASVLRADERAKNVKLTPRELEILRLVAEGLTNKEIAARRHVRQETVEHHMHNVLERLVLRRRPRPGAGTRPGRGPVRYRAAARNHRRARATVGPRSGGRPRPAPSGPRGRLPRGRPTAARPR